MYQGQSRDEAAKSLRRKSQRIEEMTQSREILKNRSRGSRSAVLRPFKGQGQGSQERHCPLGYQHVGSLVTLMGALLGSGVPEGGACKPVPESGYGGKEESQGGERAGARTPV